MAPLVATLATAVAGIYLWIAFVVVPRLVRVAPGREGRALVTARLGAMAFFAGCAATHVGIAVTTAKAGGMPGMDGAAPLRTHLLPHVAQLVGGGVFVVVAHRRLSLTVMDREEAERLRTEQVQLRSAFDLAPLGIALSSVVGGRPGVLLQVNTALTHMLRIPADRMLGRSYLEFVAPEHREASESARTTLEEQGDTTQFEQELLDADGRRIWTRVHGNLVRDAAGRAQFVVAQIYDVTETRRREADLRYLADHDPLTGLLNRRRLEQELDAALAPGADAGAVLLVLDLDQFRYVNDAHGHAVGDRLLVAVAQTLGGHVGPSDVLARLGGDSFAVLCHGTPVAQARALADTLCRAVREEVEVTVGARAVRIETSVGLAPLATDGSLATAQVLAAADLAMYELKHTSRGRVALLADGADLAGVRSTLAWSDRIREALARGSFELWEQPIVTLATGSRDRSELLVRMVDPLDGRLVLPGEFLGAAERFGQITAIDRWVFGRAADLLAARHRAGDERRLEVNLSGQSLTDTEVIDEIVDLVDGGGFDPSRLMVEVTETSAVRSFDTAREVSRRLSALGCSFVLDDFGAGFGSFAYLKHLPFDGVKIDGEFIKDLPRSHADRLTVQAMATLAGGLGKELTAEFVQDDETVALLRRAGVGFGQGYHLGRPQPVHDLPLPSTGRTAAGRA